MTNIDYNKITVIDRFIAKTFLKLIPSSVTPNQITVWRFVLTPIVGWLFYKEIYDWGLVLFLFTMLTDALDGALARTTDQITEVGKIIDPLADKLAVAVVAVLLIFKFLTPLIGWLVIGLDALIMIVGGYRKYIINREIHAEIFGKLKFIFQVFGIFVLMLYVLFGQGWLLSLATYVLYLAIGLAVVSLFRPHSI